MNPLVALGEITKLVAALPPEAVRSILELIGTIAKSSDPATAARRAAIAAASEQASEAALRELLK